MTDFRLLWLKRRVSVTTTSFLGCEQKNLIISTIFRQKTRNSLFPQCKISITGSVVALHCCKAHAKINRKIGNSTPCKIVTPESVILKLCKRDYIGEMTHHANFGFNRCSGGFSPNRRNVTTLFFFDCPVLFCPVLSLLFFSILRPGRTAGPIFTLYGSNQWTFRVETRGNAVPIIKIPLERMGTAFPLLTLYFLEFF